MLNTNSDTESTSSFIDGNGDESLAAELHKIVELVKQLDDFKPEIRKKAGRPKANPEPKPTFSAPLFQLCNLTQKILHKLEQI